MRLFLFPWFSRDLLIISLSFCWFANEAKDLQTSACVLEPRTRNEWTCRLRAMRNTKHVIRSHLEWQTKWCSPACDSTSSASLQISFVFFAKFYCHLGFRIFFSLTSVTKCKTSQRWCLNTRANFFSLYDFVKWHRAPSAGSASKMDIGPFALFILVKSDKRVR